MTSAPTIIDLFCGAGGMTLGFVTEGFRPVLALDNWTPAVTTYRANLGGHVHAAELDQAFALPRAQVIIGGPPCQGFSSAGMRRDSDHRNTYVRVFAQLIAEHRPRAFVFENVEGFLTMDGGRFVLDLLDPVLSAGYRVHVRKVNAANYGVPQHRKRVIAVGGLGFDPALPAPTHSAWGAPGALNIPGLPWTPSLDEALSGMPPAVRVNCCADPFGHDFAPLRLIDLQRAKHLGPGQRMRDLPAELWHASYRKRAHRRVRDGMPTERRGGAPSGVRRLRGDEPSKAITGGALNEFLHPHEDRPLTLRECARIQTFPDDFRFHGTRSEQVQLIGNAVPPLLARAIARALRESIPARTPRRRLPGALLSFTPTVSNGMSPALRQTCEAVARRYSRNSQDQLALWAGTN